MGIRELWGLFVYAGLGKEEYQDLLPCIREENRALLKVFSQLAAIMFLLLYIASMVTQGFAADNSTTYVLCALEMLVILFFVHYILPKHPALVMVFVCIFEIVLYVFGIQISMLHPERPAVSAIAFLLVSPLLFYDRPVRLSALIVAVAVIFCGISVHFKSPVVSESDVWNTITFGLVAIATTVFIMRIKMRALAQSRRIQNLSQTDLLTGVRNRNHYETQLRAYPGMCSTNLICVYADVNGLHETNNKKGHAAGDKMLCSVAEEMRRCFGQEHTYRIGGDEFVAFRVDGSPANLPAEIEQLRQSLDEHGYHVSFGTAVYEKATGEPNMNALVSEAESNMYAAKRAFYRLSGNDRRNR